MKSSVVISSMRAFESVDDEPRVVKQSRRPLGGRARYRVSVCHAQALSPFAAEEERGQAPDWEGERRAGRQVTPTNKQGEVWTDRQREEGSMLCFALHLLTPWMFDEDGHEWSLPQQREERGGRGRQGVWGLGPTARGETTRTPIARAWVSK